MKHKLITVHTYDDGELYFIDDRYYLVVRFLDGYDAAKTFVYIWDQVEAGGVPDKEDTLRVSREYWHIRGWFTLPTDDQGEIDWEFYEDLVRETI